LIRKIYLTFDVEDFINERSVPSLLSILKLLKKNGLKGLFFITGSMAEELRHFPETLELLKHHDIGYHSTSHSVRPSIFEYTDIDDYEEAYQLSLARETSHVNPLTGEIEGEGGLRLLQRIFPDKKVEAFRAPGFSWSPPHLEALRSIGIKYDFSTNLSKQPVYYKGISFYPAPILIDETSTLALLSSLSRRDITVLDFHPNYIVNETWWDSVFFSGQTLAEMQSVPQRSESMTRKMYLELVVFMSILSCLQRTGVIEINRISQADAKLETERIDTQSVYKQITTWPIERFGYKPKFIRQHLQFFFDLHKSD